jgi:hypothetical protein
MTEVEWLACTDPQKMLNFLRRTKASDRKLRLFVCACCRRIWHKLTDKQSRRAVEVAERLADGQADPAEVAAARTGIEELLRIEDQAYAEEAQLSEAAFLYGYMDQWPRLLAESPVAKDVTTERVNFAVDARNNLPADSRPLVEFLHDIFGLLPFRPVTIPPSSLVWNDGTVVKLAQGIYDDRAFDRLPILADALEESGCDNTDMLAHCRQPGEHVRGCWAVDLILWKE